MEIETFIFDIERIKIIFNVVLSVTDFRNGDILHDGRGKDYKSI